MKVEIDIRSLPSKTALALIKLYKYFISPFLGQNCRFTPTCSSYATEAIERYGFLYGTFLAVKRLLRCNPFCRGGYDPLP